MSKFGGYISLIGGAAVIIGYFVKSLNDSYYLVLIGGIVAVLGAFMSLRNRLSI